MSQRTARKPRRKVKIIREKDNTEISKAIVNDAFIEPFEQPLPEPPTSKEPLPEPPTSEQPLPEPPISKQPLPEPPTSEQPQKEQECIISSSNKVLANIDEIDHIPTKYPDEFIEFCEKYNLKPPSISSLNGKALSIMLAYPHFYWTRDTCNKIVKKFKMRTKDSIQLFNKHSQWGIATNSGIEKGKLYIVRPYSLSKKHKMRKNFKYNGTEEDKNREIDKIKSTIQHDYIDIPNSLWQLGHKNPDTTDNSKENLILQPPIQAKYRDEYIFIDTLTKMPTPLKLKSMIEKKEINLTQEQKLGYIEVLKALLTTSI